MKPDGSVIIDTRMNTKGFKQGVVNMKQQFDGLGRSVKKLGFAIASVFAVAKIVEFGKEAIELGSDLQEVQNVVDSVFTTMSNKVNEFAKNAAESAGLSEVMAKRYAGTFGAMSKSFGFTENEAYEMSTALTQLAGDVASFYNISQDEAYTKLKSVFTGETETLKELGVVMTQNALDSYAMANGYGKTTRAMTEQEKVALRYRFVMDQLSTASGDFIRTSDSWANQVRVLKLNFDSLKATIGQGLINIFTPVIKVINILLSKLATVANAFKSFTELITGKKSSGATSASSAGLTSAALSGTGDAYNSAAEGAENLAGATEDVAGATEKANKAQKDYLSGLDEIRKLETDSYSGTSGGGSGLPGVSDAIGSVDYGNLAEGETIVEQLDNKFKDFYETIKSVIEPTIESLKRLWNEGLAKLGEFTWTALEDFYNHFLVPVAKWTFGAGIPRIVDALNNGLMKVDWGKINAGLVKLWDALTPFAINVGEGLLWFWENVLVPLGVWTMNEVVPRFLETLSLAIDALNNVIEALKPLFEWFLDNVLLPVAEWTGDVFLDAWNSINSALSDFADWCKKNPGVIEVAATAVAGFFGAWKIVELLAFIQESGGLIAVIKKITDALYVATAAKLADKLETMAITALYAKDFVDSIVLGTKELILQAKQLAINTAAKYADEAAMAGLSVAEVAWQSLMSTSIAQMALKAAAWIKETALKIADTAAQIALTAATVVWNAVCAVATAATTALGSAIAFLTSPIGIAIVAIGSIIAIGVLLYKNWDKIKEAAKKVWEYVKKTFSDASKAISSTVSSIWNGITNFFKNTFETIKNTASSVWNSMKNTASSIWNGIKTTLSNLWNSIKSTASNVFNAVKKAIDSVWNGLKNTTSSIWNGIKNTLSTLWHNLTSTARNAGSIIKNAFVNAFDSIKRLIKSPINAVIGLINGLIRGVVSGINAVFRAFNKLSVNVPSWVPGIGGKRLGFNFTYLTAPSIPYLATGAVIPPNAPFMAMLGDQKHGNNIEAPEDLIRKIVREETQNQGFGGEIRIPVIIDGRQVYEAVVRQADLARSRSGGSLFGMT